MYILSKAIYFLLNPIVWIFAAFLAALLWKKHRLKLLRTGIFLFLFFSLAPIFQLFAYLWEIPMTNIDKMEEQYDIGIVLGGFSKGSIKPYDRLHFASASTRLTTTLELYQRKKIKKILISGGSFAVNEGQVAEAERVHNFLKKLNIPEEDIIIENQSLNTRENGALTQQLINEKYKGSSCLLITSAWHMKRAKACFNKAGLELETFSTDPFAGRIDTSIYYYFFPNPSVLQGWQLLAKECFGYTMYKIVGYI